MNKKIHSSIGAANRAIKKAGGNRALAYLLLPNAKMQIDIFRMEKRIAQWSRLGVAAKWAIRVEEVTGVSRHSLRPDIYPK